MPYVVFDHGRARITMRGWLLVVAVVVAAAPVASPKRKASVEHPVSAAIYPTLPGLSLRTDKRVS